jgi:serine/threonine protein kinase
VTQSANDPCCQLSCWFPLPAQVFLARLYGSLPVAVKVMLLPDSPMLREQLQAEVSLQYRCRHPGLLQLVGVCWVDGLVFVVTELMAGGSLLSQLSNPELRYHARFVSASSLGVVCLAGP